MHIENRSFLRTMSYLSSIYYRHKEKELERITFFLVVYVCPLLLETSDKRRKVHRDHKWNGLKPKIQPSQSQTWKKTESRKLGM